ncbi:RHS repeat-associated protein [Umezawaea tangerina]|uniref:RHS repeat-associated protein n=1 Tax=Umezawaea tangerina TaxID=84725 RepID=A0A2T0T4C6_9PSEU|nr:RHS repeat-associated protein [Umezawaea tangerina]
MRTSGRRLAVLLPFVLVTSVVTTVLSPAAWAAEPSVPLPDTASTKVTEQKPDTSRGQDEAVGNELHGDQGPGGGGVDGGGTSRATPLSPSAKWDVSGQTGDFTWSYPMRVPPVPGGLAPQPALSYASSSVDGRTSATNNQASWVGDGWDLSVGFVERSYIPCANDTMDGTTPPKDVGDLCWRSDNATSSYGGSGGELVLDAAKGWHPRSDDGARVERIGSPGDATESWKITTVDGTQYFFGSRADAGSTWKLPVYGDDANEPCHRGTFETSQCVLPWRWNLDKVVDRNGNEILYDYSPETNSYGVAGKDAAVSYTRGGTLKTALYGLNTGSSEPAAAKVDFVTADRCVPGSDCTPSKKDNWPDVPWSDKCDTATCKDQHGPSFWTTKRLDKVVTSVRDGSGYRPVEQWQLDQQFPVNGDGEKPALWLKGVKHTGLAGGSVELPQVRFEGTKMPNRVEKTDGVGPLLRYRVSAIESESGGLIEVTYAKPDCVAGQQVPAAESNTLRCYPVKWAKKNFAEQTDRFQKYVVEKITESDRISANPVQETRYSYLDGAAWAWDDSELTKDDHRDYNVFHGFKRVQVRKGVAEDPSGPVTLTEERYYQGMNGDRLPSGTRQAQVVDTENAARNDDRWLQGRKFETTVFDGDTTKVVSKTISTPAVQGPTATRGALNAYLVTSGPETTYQALSAGGWRKTRTEPTYNSHGQVTRTDDLGDTTTAADDRCTTVDYAENTGAWLLTLPSLVKTVAKACTATPKLPDDAVSATRTSYDDHGNATRVEDLDQWTGTDPVTTLKSTAAYDLHGRATSTKDANDHGSRTVYTPAVGGPVTGTVVTDAAGFSTTSTLETSFGQPIQVKDANGNVTETTYDSLGRTTEVWLPNRPRTSNPHGNQYFAYDYRQDDPTVVTTTSLGPNGNYTTSKEIYDGLLRLRQKQTPSPGGGRLIADSAYDSQGRQFRATNPYYNSAPVDDRIWVASDADVPSQAVNTYDGVGRQKTHVIKGGAQELWRVTAVYDGDRVTVTPPAGATAGTSIYDARGRLVEFRQYHGTAVQATYDRTTYAYTPADQLAGIVDPSGQAWKRTYDLHGRKVVDEDPDKGVTALAYDKVGNLVSRKDARGTVVVFGYDDLDRKTSERLDSSTGPVQAEWTYDSALLGKGLPATSTRYAGGLAYRDAVEGYDPLGKVVGSTVTIPASTREPGLAGSYTTYLGYKADGHIAGRSFTEAGSLAAESVSYTYDDLGHPLTMTGGDGDTVDYVSSAEYTRYGEIARTTLGEQGKRLWLSNYYDPNTRRLQRSIVDAEVPSPMQSDVNYSYDPSGNITSVSDKAPGRADTQCFRYDDLLRLAEAWTPASAKCGDTPDVATLGGAAPYWQSFTYDVSGNRLTQTQHATGGNTVQTSTYPASGQPRSHAVTAVATKGPGVDTSGQVTYDAAGNVKVKPGQALDWDAEGRLAKVTQGGTTTEFVYDADGERLLRRDPTGTTLYLDGQELRVTKATGAKSATRYYQFGDQTVAMRDASGLTWLAGDHQGTSQVAVTSTGLQVTRKRQTPFGGTRGSAVFPGERGFVGGTNDPSTGLVHLGAREYDPVLGRFLSVDSLLTKNDAQSMNGYTYSDNNPLTYADPSGRSLWGRVFGAISTFASIGALLPPPAGLVFGAVAVVSSVADAVISVKEGDYRTAVLDGVSAITGIYGKALGWAVKGADKALEAASAVDKSAEVTSRVVDGVAKGVDGAALGTATGGWMSFEGHYAEERYEEPKRQRDEWERTQREMEAAPATDMGCYAAGNRSQTIGCDSPDAVRPLGASYCKSGNAVPSDCIFSRKERIDQQKMPGRMNLGPQPTKKNPATGRPNPSEDYRYGTENSKRSGFYESSDGIVHRNSGGGRGMF